MINPWKTWWGWLVLGLVYGALAGLVIGGSCLPAHAAEWYTVSDKSTGVCYAEWTPAPGNPDGYEVFACDWQDFCVYVMDVTEPKFVLSLTRWIAVKRQVGALEPRIKARAYRGDERGPYSVVSAKGVGVR